MVAIVGAAGDKAARLEQRVEVEKDAYGALQTYKTFHARAMKKEDLPAALDLCRSGACVLLRSGHLTAGTELALLLADSLETGRVEKDEGSKAVVLEVSAAMSTFAAGDEASKNVKAEAAKNHARFLKACIAWSTLKRCGQHERGDPDLHHLAAKAKVAMGDLPGASTHYLHARQPKEFALFLFQWSTLGYANERDLFLAKVVLQLLALENLQDANTVHSAFLALLVMKKTPLKSTPLSNFVAFLLKTVERDAFKLFQVLCTKYQPALRRDPSFQAYLDRISEIYFGVKPQKTGIQAMMEMFSGGAR